MEKYQVPRTFELRTLVLFSSSSSAEIIGEGRTNSMLRIGNTRCIGMHNANLALVFATTVSNESYSSCCFRYVFFWFLHVFRGLHVFIEVEFSKNSESMQLFFQKDGHNSCYIIGHSDLKEGDKWEFKRDETVGLKAFDGMRS